MNSRVIVLLLICFILLSGCFSAKQDTSEPSKHGIELDDSVKTDISYEGSRPKVPQEAGKPSVSILDLYGKWNGHLICNAQSYAPGSTIFFSEESVECDIQLNFEKGLNTTTDDLQLLEEKYISVEKENELLKQSNERFDYIDLFASSQHPNLIRLRVRPSNQSLKIIFKTNTAREPTAFYFEYAEPLTYTISRPFEADGKIHATGVRHYLQTGESHIYNITFSQAVDKVSVERIVDNQLEGIDKHIQWLSDRSLSLVLRLEKKDLMQNYEEYYLNLTGVKTQKGLINSNWHENQIVRFQPTNMKHYYTNNLLNGSEQPLFNSLISYSSLDISPNGKWILAEELSSRQSVFVTNYSLLDCDGKRFKELQMKSPIWLPDGNSLLYADQNSILRYEIPTGDKYVIWSDPGDTAIMSFDYDRASGRMLVAAGHSDQKGGVPIDLYLFDSVNDGNPLLLKEALYNQDDIAWSGLHYSLPIYFIGGELLYLESNLPSDEQNQKVRSIMDWKSGKSRNLDKKGELYPANEGKMLHGENSKWNVYDVESGKETPLNFSVSNEEWLAVKSMREGMIMMSVSNAKHYILNLNKLSLQQIPGSLHILSSHVWNGDAITVK